MRAISVVASFVLVLSAAAVASAEPVPVHGMAMHGAPKYGPNFAHFDYVDPDAPKGGSARLAAIGTFDNLNPFIIIGNSATGLGMVYDTLTTRAEDEAFSEYGLLAETITVPEDRSWVEFTLRPEARWHDGRAVTADDVIWSFHTLRDKGAPFYRFYYGSVEKAEKVDERTVRFEFGAAQNRELPLIVGQLPVLPRHYWEGREFDRTTLEPPLSSGPYRVESFEPGRSITYALVEDYWGRDLPVNKGRNNIARIRYDYYRDATVALEAFKAGAFDFRLETSAKDWATGYDVPAVRQGSIKLENIAHDIPTGMQGFAFNIRRDLFKDPRVREALSYALDFEWSNQNLFHGQYTRSESYFSNSELASSGLPDEAELAILEPFRGRIPDRVFTHEYHPPRTDGSGQLRESLRAAVGLLREAGWTVGRDRKLRHAETGQVFEFELLLGQPAFERIAMPFKKNLERLGIDMRVRVVDSSVFQERSDSFDFDMMVAVFGQSLSPGNEQREYWGSDSAERRGSRNVIGINDPAVDELIELLIAAPDREALIARTRAFDRVLLWGHYVIPHWHIQAFRVAYWDKFGRPQTSPRYALGFDTWWIDPARGERN